MNRRRMMMEEHKISPLYIFEYGRNALTNGSLTSRGAFFSDGEIVLGSDGKLGGYINIKGIDFSKYKTLKIECYTNINDYEEYYYVHYCGYGESEDEQESGYTAYKHAPSYYQVLSFDISKAKGEKIIKATADHNGTAVMYIKNIRME